MDELAERRIVNQRQQNEFNDAWDDAPVDMAWQGERFKHGDNATEHIARVNIQKGGVARSSLSDRMPGANAGDPYVLVENQGQLKSFLCSSLHGTLQLTLAEHAALEVQVDGQPKLVQSAAQCDYEQMCRGFVRLYTSQNSAMAAVAAAGRIRHRPDVGITVSAMGEELNLIFRRAPTEFSELTKCSII